jgi:hypothetical protein
MCYYRNVNLFIHSFRIKFKTVLMKTITQGISKLFRPTTGASFAHQIKEHSLYQYMSVNCFRGAAQKRVDLNTLDFCLWGH